MAGGAILKGSAASRPARPTARSPTPTRGPAILEGNAQANRIRDLARIQLGRQIGAQAESGFAVGTGSAIDSLVESQTNAELDAMDAMRTARAAPPRTGPRESRPTRGKLRARSAA
jgi:hypothetical protein